MNEHSIKEKKKLFTVRDNIFKSFYRYSVIYEQIKNLLFFHILSTIL